MQTSELMDVCEIIMGQAPVGSSYNENSDGYALIAGAGDFGDVVPSPKKYTTEPTRISKKNDLVLCIRATIGDLNWSDSEYCLGRGVAGLRPKKGKLDKNYLWHFINANKGQLAAKGTGSTFKQVSRSHIGEWEIPLPPLAEQKRIAAILDKADAIRRKRQQAIQLADQFLRAVFLDMFGDPVTNGWEAVPVEKLALDKKGSMRTGPFGSQLLHSEFTDEGIAVLGIDNAVANEFRWAKPRYISEQKYQELKRYTVHPGDILITIMGTCGRTAIVPDDCPTAINTKHLCCISLDKEKCTPEFLHSYFLMHPASKEYLARTAKGAVMDGLNMGIIKELPVFLPPIDLQRKYSTIQKRILKSKESSESTKLEGEQLFSSLSQKAFAGEL